MGKTVKWMLPALVFALGLLGGCGWMMKNYDQVADQDVIAEGDARVDSSAGDASNLNPLLSGDSASQEICDLVFSGLVRYNPKLELEGHLAENWKIEDNGRRIIFNLRRGVKWHDGQPFTAEDVLFTYRALMNPKLATPRRGPFELVKSVVARDAFTVVVNYSQPFAPALEAWSLGIIPKHLLEGKDLMTDPFNRAPVGTGPYKFVRWKPNESIELAANQDYFEGCPHLRRYLYRILPDSTGRLLELKSEGIDSAPLTPDQYLLQKNNTRYNRICRSFRFPGLNQYTYFGFNLAKPMFRDLKLRQALSCAIDRPALIQMILRGLGGPCTGPYSPLMPAYNSGVEAVACDLTRSARLLDEAGWKMGAEGLRVKDGRPLKFSLATNKNPIREQVATVLQQQFRKVGAQADVQVLEWAVFVSQYLDKKNFDTIVMGWQLSLDPDIYDIWHSSRNHENEFNFISYNNPEVDRLLARGRTTFDWKQRLQIYRRVHRILADEQPVAFLFSPDSLTGLNKRFRGLLDSDTGFDWYWTTRWYVPKSIQLHP